VTEAAARPVHGRVVGRLFLSVAPGLQRREEIITDRLTARRAASDVIRDDGRGGQRRYHCSYQTAAAVSVSRSLCSRTDARLDCRRTHDARSSSRRPATIADDE